MLEEFLDLPGKQLVAALNASTEKQIETAVLEALKTSIDPNIQLRIVRFATKFGFPQIVKLMIREKCELDIASDHGWTPLMIACRNGHEEIALDLIEAGANIHAVHVSYPGQNAISHASAHGLEKVVTSLIKKNADFNLQSNVRLNALMVALKKGHEKIALDLIDAGAEIHARTVKQETSLMFACSAGLPCVVKALIEKKANVNAVGNSGYSPLTIACQNFSDSAKDRSPEAFVFQEESRKKCEKIALRLIKAQADINLATNKGQTPLFIAIETGLNMVVKLLLDHPKINLNTQCCHGYTALMKALIVQREAVALDIIAHGCDVHLTNDRGKNALMQAICCGSMTVVKLLVEKNIDINATMNNGWTALMYACYLKEEDIAVHLIQNCCDVFMKDKCGQTAFDFAKTKKLNTVKQYLASQFYAQLYGK